MLYKFKPLSFLLLGVLLITIASTTKLFAQIPDKNRSLNQIFDNYYEGRLKLFPLEATEQGDLRYNGMLPNDGSATFIKELHNFYIKYQNALKAYDYKTLNKTDQLSYDILMDIIARGLGEEKFHPEYMPVTQVHCLPTVMGQLGSGTGAQPFKTFKDYNDWLKRVSAFSIWVDTAIANCRKGVKAGIVLPKAAVIKIIPQMNELAETDSAKSIFYGPVKNFPKDFSAADRKRLIIAYDKAIQNKLIPSYKKLSNFFSNEYLAEARTTSGLNALPNGDSMYQYYIWNFTTTHKTPQEIYNTGISEVARITAEIEKIKDSIGFKGTLKDLFEFMKTDKQFMPFKTNEEVLNAYRAILKKIEPHLNDLFGLKPKTPFEIREVEAYRAGSQPPQYNAGSLDGKMPGIFYVPIVDPTKVNVTGWPMESVFLHEAIPGHHYQISIQQENTDLPKFRRSYINSAFAEGWALYTESLGEQLGCYTDPYQKLGALSIEMHRAIRLVMDVALHTGKMTREQAIEYMSNHEALPEAVVINEIERFMVWPGQALSYKIGELEIITLRNKYQQELGAKFSLKNFHDALLEGGCMPLNVLENYMDEWALTQL